MSEIVCEKCGHINLVVVRHIKAGETNAEES